MRQTDAAFAFDAAMPHEVRAAMMVAADRYHSAASEWTDPALARTGDTLAGAAAAIPPYGAGAAADDAVVSDLASALYSSDPAELRELFLIAAENFHEVALDMPRGAGREAFHSTANALVSVANSLVS